MPKTEEQLAEESNKLNAREQALINQTKELYESTLRANGFTKTFPSTNDGLKYLIDNPDVWKRNEEAPKKEDEEDEEKKKKEEEKETVEKMNVKAGIPSVRFPNGETAEADPTRINASSSDRFIRNPTKSPKTVTLFTGGARINALPPGKYGEEYIDYWKVIA